jgi:hypothetical protein
MRYMRAEQIEAAVRKLYEKNGNVVLSQVRNGTGYGRSVRTADMLIASTWPSRGLFLEGVEIKVSRSDLQSELANPKKADEIAKYCKWWWLAVPDDLITPEMMIPETWGILAVDDKGKASIARRGTMLSPIPMDTLLVCSVLRNVSESYVPASEIDDRVKAAVEERLKSMREDRNYRLQELEKAFAEFREATGVDLMTDRNHPIWDMRGAGDAVKLLMEMRSRPADELRDAAVSLRKASTAIEQAMAVVGVSAEVEP